VAYGRPPPSQVVGNQYLRRQQAWEPAGDGDECCEAQMNEHEPEPQLPEEVQFRNTLIATVVVSGVFGLAFGIFLVGSALVYPGRNTAEWYTSWGVSSG
jgi:hypothetical protein